MHPPAWEPHLTPRRRSWKRDRPRRLARRDPRVFHTFALWQVVERGQAEGCKEAFGGDEGVGRGLGDSVAIRSCARSRPSNSREMALPKISVSLSRVTGW